jgi:hypothetical protein
MANAKQNKTKYRPGPKQGEVASSVLTEVVYEVYLQPGEVFGLPTDVTDKLGPGRWRVFITSADDSAERGPVRDHIAFLNSYAAGDDGLYDDYPAG